MLNKVSSVYLDKVVGYTLKPLSKLQTAQSAANRLRSRIANYLYKRNVQQAPEYSNLLTFFKDNPKARSIIRKHARNNQKSLKSTANLISPEALTDYVLKTHADKKLMDSIGVLYNNQYGFGGKLDKFREVFPSLKRTYLKNKKDPTAELLFAAPDFGVKPKKLNEVVQDDKLYLFKGMEYPSKVAVTRALHKTLKLPLGADKKRIWFTEIPEEAACYGKYIQVIEQPKSMQRILKALHTPHLRGSVSTENLLKHRLNAIPVEKRRQFIYSYKDYDNYETALPPAFVNKLLKESPDIRTYVNMNTYSDPALYNLNDIPKKYHKLLYKINKHNRSTNKYYNNNVLYKKFRKH